MTTSSPRSSTAASLRRTHGLLPMHREQVHRKPLGHARATHNPDARLHGRPRAPTLATCALLAAPRPTRALMVG